MCHSDVLLESQLSLTRREIILGSLTLTALMASAEKPSDPLISVDPSAPATPSLPVDILRPEQSSVTSVISKTYTSVTELIASSDNAKLREGDVVKAGPYRYEVLSQTMEQPTEVFDIKTADGMKLKVLAEDVVSPSQFGLEPDVSAPDNSQKFQKFIDFISETGCKGLAKAGVYILPESVSAKFARGTEHAFTLSGAGNGTVFHFLDGSLKIHRGNHLLSDFRVKSDTDHGIQIAPVEIGVKSRKETAPRGAMYNVRAEYCAKSGFYFEYCWIYTLVNCFGRYCGDYGLQLGNGRSVGCNAFNLIGGEWQGNGKAVNDGASKSTGGGIFLGRSVHVDINTTIEGNYGDGLVIGEQVRGLKISGYFEKNGSNHLDLDIHTLRPRIAAKASADIFISVVNFTPQNLNGKAQLRAMKFVDVDNLKITHAKFFKQHANGGVVYKKEPILVSETRKGKATGWVENSSFVASAYTQDFIKNECDKFGFPEKSILTPTVIFPADKAEIYHSVMLHNEITDGKRVEALVIFMMDDDKVLRQQKAIRMITKYGVGPKGKVKIIKTDTVPFTAGDKVAVLKTQTSKDWDGFIHLSLERKGTNFFDTLPRDIRLSRIEIIKYQGYR